MEPAYFVSQFSPSILSILIKQCFGSEFSDIQTKPQVKTIVRQLDALGAKTIVCEREYIDKDYSDDYANYYVQSFKDYRGSCARLHFFSKEFSQENFADILGNVRCDELTLDEVKEKYLGFVVIKPLPFTFLGRTCIASSIDTKISREYRANLFGIALSVRSVAFQEQDRVVSACATTAVWSLLHALPDVHNRNIPSPSAITLAAIGSPLQNVNGFPNKGLNLAQITAALESLRLKQHSFLIGTFNAQEQLFLRKYVEFYINSEIPVFVGARIFKARQSEPLLNKSSALRYAMHGDHAVVVTGITVHRDSYDLVVHDDRVGPYIPMKLVPVYMSSDGISAEIADKCGDGTTWAFQSHGSDEMMIPTTALVATYPKKKIGVEPIISTGELLLKAFKNFYLPTCDFSGAVLEAANEIYYTVKLLECNSLKSDYFQTLDEVSIRSVLVAHLPRFIWKIQYLVDGRPVVDFLFDATDTPNGNPFIRHVRRDSAYGELMLAGLREIGAQMRIANEFDRVYCAINEAALYSYHIDVLRRFAPSALKYSDYLSDLFGSLRSPRYIKNFETLAWPGQILPGDVRNRHRFYSLEMARGFDLPAFINSLQSDEKRFAIWVIDEEGALNFGPDSGHPNLTDANPARIAGELHRCECSAELLLNAKSGRYSGQYAAELKAKYLENARKKWSELFPSSQFSSILLPERFATTEIKRSPLPS